MDIHVARSIRFAAALLLAASIFTAAGCSDDSPTGPSKDTEPVIKTPWKMRINYILMRWNALQKPNGDDWDLDPFNATNRLPDVFFKLGNYTTNVLKNFDWLEDPGVEKLSFSAPNYGQMNYDGTYTLQLLDQDGVLQGADDLIGQVKFRPDEFYRNDNAEEFNIEFLVPDKFDAYAIGEWIY
jgi:hypothetical protein